MGIDAPVYESPGSRVAAHLAGASDRFEGSGNRHLHAHVERARRGVYRPCSTG